MTDSEKLDLLLEKVTNLDNKVEELDNKVTMLDNRMTRMELALENETNRNIKIVAEGHFD